MDGMIGEELDRDGFEYATNFSSFSISRKRRKSNALDCVRRRKWVRTRVPIAGTVDERFRPLIVFWDVNVLQSGTRRVDVRSGLQIRNLMPFGVTIVLGGSAISEREFGPIDENGTFNVPLQLASASWVKIRPADFPYEWCQNVSCSLQPFDYATIRDVHCTGVGCGAVPGEVVEEEEISPICMRVLSNQSSKSLCVTVAPVIVMTNMLPCDLQYIWNSSNRKRDEGKMVSGSSNKLANVDLSFTPKISFRVGDYTWTEPRTLDPLAPDPVRVDVMTGEGTVGAVLTVLVSTSTETGTVNVCVYSKGILCDRSGGLGVSLWWRRGRLISAGEMTRRTSTPPEGTSPRLRSVVPPVERQRRLTILRTDEKNALKAYKKSLLTPSDESALVRWSDTATGTNSTLKEVKEEGLEIGEGEGEDDEESLTGVKSDEEIENIKIVVSNLISQSKYPYEVVCVDIGDSVYTDRGLKWTHLPSQLRNQLCIRTPCNDESTRSKHLIRFTVDKSCLVLLLFDVRATRPPHWLNDDGYHKISNQAIGRIVTFGVMCETHYSIFGKYHTAGEVVLRGNWSKEMHSMYSIFLIPVPQDMIDCLSKDKKDLSKDDSTNLSINSKEKEGEKGEKSHENGVKSNYSKENGLLRKMFEEVTFYSRYTPSDSDNCWVKGGNGLSLFCAEEDTVSVGVQVFTLQLINFTLTVNNAYMAHNIISYTLITSFLFA